MAVLALLSLAVIALLADRGETVLKSLGLTTGQDDRQIHVLEIASATLPKKISGEAGFAEFPLRQHGEWTGLAGFTGDQSFDLPLPRETKFSDAVVFVDVGVELEKDTTGRLRFGVNGQPRGEIVLNPGNSELLVKIPLQPIDKAREWVNVTVSVVGNNPKAECTSDWTGGVVVSIEPTTHVRVALEQPITSKIDQWILSGAPARIIWPYAAKSPDAGPEVDLTWKWQPFVLDAVFVDVKDARETDVGGSLNSLFKNRNERIEKVQLFDLVEGISEIEWPVPIGLLLKTSPDREFRNRTVWNIAYDRIDMPDRQLPDVMNLKLGVNSSGETAAWLLNVFLNSQLVHSERIDANERVIERQVELPLLAQALGNLLRITLTSDEEKTGRCTQGQPAVAQIMLGTNLDQQGDVADPIFAGLLEATTLDADLYIAETVDAQEANFGFYTLSKIFGITKFHTATSDLKNSSLERGLVVLLDSDQLGETFKQLGDDKGTAWFAFSAITLASEPEVFAFKGDDPMLKKALELYNPISILVALPPGFQI